MIPKSQNLLFSIYSGRNSHHIFLKDLNIKFTKYLMNYMKIENI